MDAQREGRFRKHPCLTPPQGDPASKNPLSTLRAPQTCVELKAYLQNVRALERVREAEWRTFQPLLDLANSGVWQWRSDVHFALLSWLYRLSGTVFAPDGLLVYSHVLETVACIAPRDRTDLSRYLNLVVHHNLLPQDQHENFRFLSRVVAQPTWEWNKATHQATLDILQEAIGVILTPRGPLHMSLCTILQDAPARETHYPHREGRGAGSAPNVRMEGQGSSNPGAPTAAVAGPDPDNNADSDAHSRHRHF